MSERKRIVRLYCPSLSKEIYIHVLDNERIDLGTISRAFGINPHTLKLNGHFISRGSDLIACSVTWRSLISFFSSRGWYTGEDGSGAIVVHGKLCKAGTKRAQEVDGQENEIDSSTANLRLQLADFHLVKNKKLKENSSGYIDWNNKVKISNGFSLKRKRQQEDLNIGNGFSLKRKRQQEDLNIGNGFSLKRKRQQEDLNIGNGFSLKRKRQQEDFGPLRR